MSKLGTNKKISAATARSPTRKSNSDSTSSSGLLKILLFVFFAAFSAWVYQTAVPPPPKTLGSPNGPPIASPRIKLRDGRHISYIECGVPKDVAKSKLIYIHCFDCSKYHNPFAAATPAVVEELGVYILSIDRPGYGESDPHSKRTVKSLALDIEEIADEFNLGPTFYVGGFSMGGQVIWSCLKYIPHRLAGAVLMAPGINFWWHNLPSNLINEAYSRLLKQDQWAYRVAHYLTWGRAIAELMLSQPRLQGEYESVYRDLNIGFGKWDFDPLDLENPFPNNNVSVHLWIGDEDLIVPVTPQRYIAQQLGWIKYHEVKGGGHLFPFMSGVIDAVLKEPLN